MENPINVLTEQVKTYLVDLKLREPDRFQIYQQFYGQCEQFEISEEDFFKNVLNPAYRDINFDDLIDDPDPRNEKNTHVFIFGEKIHSLKRLGQVLFDNHQRSNEYLEDMSLIKNHVDTLSTGDDALEFARLYRSENDSDKKFLRIVYRLNPKLPYRIGNEFISTLETLLERGFQDLFFYNLIYDDFASGKLLIWLSEVNGAVASMFSGGKSYNAFLRFVYSIDDKYPFYLGEELYANPEAIVGKLKINLLFRKMVYSYIQNDQLFTWFDSIGRFDWQISYVSAAAKLVEQKLKGDELINESVEKLINIISPETELPKLKTSIKKLTLLNIEAGKSIAESFQLKLTGRGYVKAKIMLDYPLIGISLDTKQVLLFDLNNKIERVIKINIDPLNLTKDKLYQFNIRVVTDYQILEIPVKLKTVFPLRSFITHLLKYGALGFLAMALFRFLLGAFTGNFSWLKSYLITSNLHEGLPSNYPAYIFLLFIFIVMVAGVFPLIKKVEKL